MPEKQWATLENGAGRVAMLLEETRRLMAERDPVALLRQVCLAAQRMTQADIVGLGLVDEAGEVEDLVSPGLDEPTLAEIRRLVRTTNDHPARPVIERREVVRGVNPSGDPEAICLPPTHPPVHSYLFVPVASPSRVYGWLALVEKAGAGIFSEEDAQLAATFGALAGMAYENARMVVRLEAQARELREHDEQTDFALSAAHAGVSYRNLDSLTVALSKSMAVLFGLPPDTRRISQDELYRRVHPDDGPILRAAVARAVEEGSEFALEFRYDVIGAGMRWFNFRGRVKPGGPGEPARVVGVISDITDRRSLELQLRQAQKMEALGQLAGGIAHDFNNLLTAIIGYGRFALESSRDAAQRHDIEEIVKAAGRAAALTKQLLAFSRRHVVETIVIDLNLLIVDMASMLRRMIGEDIELVTSLAAGLAHVRADRSQLEQVVMNLVINARDACGTGGRIRLVTKEVHVDPPTAALLGLGPGRYVALAVEDNGSGMDESTKSRLFEPFFTTKPRGQGTGLGLATVYGIVVQSGGGIQVESDVGRGATFTVYLPPDLETQSSGERPPEVHVQRRSRTVLLVEDEQAVRELVRLILERAGHRVVEAATPEDALALADTLDTVDLLLTDVVMPGMSGFDLFRTLARRMPSLPVLFMSGYTDYARFDPAISDTGAAFLEKPFTAETLIAKVTDALGQ